MQSGPVLFATTFLLADSARADEAGDRAAKVIESAGGQVLREASLPGEPILGVVPPPKFGPDELKGLSSFKTLLALSLSGPGVTDAGVKEFAKALPKCQVVK